MIKYIAGPLIGMIIGYCTNYIAVRMLFRPRTEKYLFGHRIPLTPGAIPKGQKRLAKAAGAVVAENLITGSDISEKLLVEDIEGPIVDEIMSVLDAPLEETVTAMTNEQQTEALIEGVEQAVTDKVLEAIGGYNYREIVREQGLRAIKEKLGGSMLMMFVSDEMILGILDGVVECIDRYIEENGETAVKPLVGSLIDDVRSDTPVGLMMKAGYDEAEVRAFVTRLYRRAATAGVSRVLEHINIAEVVEEKISGMSVEELERIVLDVMKKELDMIVNLGALIGFVLGLLNIFI